MATFSPLVLAVLLLLLVVLTWSSGGGTAPPPAQEPAPPGPPAGPEPAPPSAPGSSPAPDIQALRRSLHAEGHIQRPFFDPSSAADKRLATYGDRCPIPLEVDTPEGFARTQQPPFAAGADFVVYQNWGPTTRGSDGRLGRPFMWLAEERARDLGAALRDGPTTKLWLVVTMFGPGALRAFADAVGPGQLEMLGLLWYFSGDDFTDEAENAADVAYLARTLGLSRLAILTAAWDAGCEARLAKALEGQDTLEVLRVFEKDDGATWPRVATPLLDELCPPGS